MLSSCLIESPVPWSSPSKFFVRSCWGLKLRFCLSDHEFQSWMFLPTIILMWRFFSKARFMSFLITLLNFPNNLHYYVICLGSLGFISLTKLSIFQVTIDFCSTDFKLLLRNACSLSLLIQPSRDLSQNSKNT